MKWGPYDGVEKIVVTFPRGLGRDRREYRGVAGVRVNDTRPVKVFGIERDGEVLNLDLSDEPAKMEKVGRTIFIIGKT